MLVSDIQSRVKNLFGDTAGVQITDSMILDWINDAQKDICRKAECLESIYTANVVAGTTTVNYPTDFIRELWVKISGIKMTRLTPPSIDQLFPDRDAENVTGNSLYYYHFNRQINLYPNPSTSITNGLKMGYIRYAVDLTGSGQTPEIPLIFHEDLVQYCFWKALLQDEQFPAARDAKQDYDNRLIVTIYDSRNPVGDAYPAVTLLAGDY